MLPCIGQVHQDGKRRTGSSFSLQPLFFSGVHVDVDAGVRAWIRIQMVANHFPPIRYLVPFLTLGETDSFEALLRPFKAFLGAGAPRESLQQAPLYPGAYHENGLRFVTMVEFHRNHGSTSSEYAGNTITPHATILTQFWPPNSFATPQEQNGSLIFHPSHYFLSFFLLTYPPAPHDFKFVSLHYRLK